MALKSGTYVAKVTKDVVVWPEADHNGDGEVVLRDNFDRVTGQSLGQSIVKDEYDREVRQYLAPDGFKAVASSVDNKVTWVKVDERGSIVRQPNGEAVTIRPGDALVVAPDGSVEVLSGEYAQYVFNKLHDEEGAEV